MTSRISSLWSLSTRKKTLVLVTVVLVCTPVFMVFDSRFFGITWSPEHGFCYVSQTYDTDGNSTYSTLFRGINFTFLYSKPAVYDIVNGTVMVALDSPDIAYFLVSFSDGTETMMTLTIGGMPTTFLVFFDFVRSNSTTHGGTVAGVMTSDVPGMYYDWQYFVST